jgi:hypothetical protein
VMYLQLGEGLCPRGMESSATVKPQTITLGNNGDIFVGGSFYSRVWDGIQAQFVDIKYIAQFNGSLVLRSRVKKSDV